MTRPRRLRRPCRRHGLYSLRAKLTLANVVLLAVGVVTATAFSAMGMRLYLLDSVDRELMTTRDSIGAAAIGMEQIDALSALVAVSNRTSGGPAADGADSLVQGAVFTALGDGGEPLTIAGFPPTEEQRALAAAVGDPAALLADDEPYDVDVAGAPHRVTAARMDDGTTVLLATSTASLHDVIAKALRLDFAVGGLLLATLACLTLFGVRRRMRPLEDMVETSSAIAEGDLTRRVPSSRETTLEVEQLRLALNSMLQQVETAHHTRERSAAQLRRFVGDASHELRTPLAAIRGYLQLHDKGMLTDPDERRRAWDRMNNEVDRMGRLVDELLTLARLDQRPELRLRNVDVARLVRDAAADLRAQQPDRPVTVHADGTLLVRADESGLRQLLGNLVSNVRTHTPADVPVRLGVECAAAAVRLYVADEGPGLSQEDAARIFDRFFRAGGAAGSGLGMAIVQGVVEAHEGEVSVCTAPGDGLKVTVTLPPAPRPSSRAVPGSTPPTPRRGAPRGAAPALSPPSPPPP